MTDAAFSRETFPAGGWSFYQPQTGWQNPMPKASTFNQSVQAIIKHRAANPAIVAKHSLSLDPIVVANELETYTRARLGLPAIGGALPKMTPPQEAPKLSEGVKQAVAAVVKLAAGGALLLDWEQSGLPPVDKEVAESRAAVCADCPQNAKGKSLTDLFTVPAANMIKRRFERLEGMNLVTSKDAELATCQACLCPLRLKIFSPMEIIQKHLKPAQRSELDKRCWILK